MFEHFTLDLPDEAATLALGAQLAKVLAPNSSIFLQGDLGAGKTTLTRGLLRGLGFEGKVKSPTYTILESYDINRENRLEFTVNHFDLYRFNDEEEWEAAGFREAFNADSVCLIEWAEKAIHCLPQPDLEVGLAIDAKSTLEQAGRVATIKAFSDHGNKMLSQLII